MLLSGLMILEATLHYPSGASFNTMVRICWVKAGTP